ncbi:MAG: 2-oxoacid:acceptor oxidoreductase family protein [Candidatus Hodarchaeales archaeon]|jgi:pyruvate ferredoxin oxidoreductase gamma subunit
MMTEIRILSRGGQGGVSGAKMLAYAGHLDGKYVQAIPKYGAERKGAPIYADCRIADEHVKTHAPVIIENTHSWIVLEPSLVSTIPVDKLTPGTIIIINSQDIPESLRNSMNIKIGLVDGVSIAQECGLIKSGTVMVSTTMLGAWAKATGLVSLESLKKAVKHKFGEGALTDANIRSVEMAYESFQYVS